VITITIQNQEKKPIPFNEQMKKFMIKSFYGFNTILSYGLGKRLGIFNYLHEKALATGDSDTVSFTLGELSEEFDIDLKYIDAWAHVARECGLFEIEEAEKKSLKTAPHVYNLLINPNHMFYIGDTLGLFYNLAPAQVYLSDIFKNGNSLFDLGKDQLVGDMSEEDMKEIVMVGQRSSARFGAQIEGLFSNTYKDFSRILKKEGTILAVGCGYGFNLEKWASRYKKTRFVGIDIDPDGIDYAKTMIEKHGWNDRIEVRKITVNEHVENNENQYDMIILNQVLHEMDNSDEYRKDIFEDLYLMLKNDGILLVGDSMIPDIFDPVPESQIFEVVHKFLEVGYARFYDVKSFKTFVDSTSFKNAEFVKNRGFYFWAITK